MQLQQLIQEYSLVVAAAGSALVHCYQIVVKGGGLKGIYRRFVNGEDKKES